MERMPLAPTNRPTVETHIVTEAAAATPKPPRAESPLAATMLGLEHAAARPAIERVCCGTQRHAPAEEDDDAELAQLREQLKATERALERRKREEATASPTPFLRAVFDDASFDAPPATPTSPPGLIAPEAARPHVRAAAAARERLHQTQQPRRQRLSATKQRETPVRVVHDETSAGCFMPSCFEETYDSEIEVEVARASDERKAKVVVKVHRARRLVTGGAGLEAFGATNPYVRATYGDQRRETTARRRTASPCWQEELVFEAGAETRVKLLFYSRNDFLADSLLGGCVVDLGVCPNFSLGAPRPLLEKSWLAVAPETRSTGPAGFLFRQALGSVEVSAYGYRAP